MCSIMRETSERQEPVLWRVRQCMRHVEGLGLRARAQESTGCDVTRSMRTRRRRRVRTPIDPIAWLGLRAAASPQEGSGRG